MRGHIPILPLVLSLLLGECGALAPGLVVEEFHSVPCVRKDPLATAWVYSSRIVPKVLSVRPNSTDTLSVVLEVELEDAHRLLRTNDVLVSWTASKDAKTKPSTVDSRRYKILKVPEANTFSIVIAFTDPPNGTSTNVTANNNKTALSSAQAISMQPLWHRVTFFYVRLLATSSDCEFASSVSNRHAEWPAPCNRDEYLSVLNRGWYVPGSSRSNPSSRVQPADFFNFIHQPVRADSNTVVCKPCPRGLDCAQNPSAPDPRARKPAVGFHGGVVVKAGYWRVDWSMDAENVAVPCKNRTACVYGGTCLPGSHRAGPKCETCAFGYGMRIGGCVACDHQDLVPLVVILSLVFVIALIMTLLRKQLVEMRFIWRDLGRIVKVLIDTMQIIASMPEVLGGIEWPDELLVVFSYMDLSSLDISQFLGISCFGQREATYYARSGMLLSLLVLVFLTAAAAFKIGRWSTSRWWRLVATDKEKQEFVRASMFEVFELADIDDNGHLDCREAKEVARLIGNKTIEKELVLAMHKIRGVKSVEENTKDKDGGRQESKEEQKDEIEEEEEGKEKNQDALSTDLKGGSKDDIFMHCHEFVDFMAKMDNIGPIALQAASKNRLREMLTLFTPFLLILHTPVTARIFELFACDKIGGSGMMIRSTGVDIYEGGGSPNAAEWDIRLTRGFLPGDYKLPCMDFTQVTAFPEIVMFYIASFLFLVIVTIGFPMALIVYMWLRRKKFYTFAVYSEIGFLYERFKRGHEFADLHILIYKTLLCAFIVFLQPWPQLQSVIALSISVVYLTWFAWSRPMRNTAVTKVCLYGFCSTCFMYMSMNIFEETGGDAVDPSVKMFFVVLICIACIGLLVAGGLAMAINLRTAHLTFTTLRKKRMEEGALDDKGRDDEGPKAEEKQWRGKNIRKRVFRKSTAVVPYSESDISKMSPAVMEEELRRLMVMQKEITASVTKGNASPRPTETTVPTSESRKSRSSPSKNPHKNAGMGGKEDIVNSMDAVQSKDNGDVNRDEDVVEKEAEEVEEVVDLTKDGEDKTPEFESESGLDLARQSVRV